MSGRIIVTKKGIKDPVKNPLSNVLILAITMGLIITWVDSRPNWDDTGMTMFFIFSAAIICGYLTPEKPWLMALALSVWIPFYNIVSSLNYGTLLALIPGFIGAYAGFFIKQYFTNKRPE